MESLIKKKMIDLPNDALIEVRKEYNLDKPGRMDEAIDLFEEWIKKQQHFTRTDFDRDYLERLIIMAKGSVEKAKSRLDKLCTWRTMSPHFFEDVDIAKDFSHFFENLYHVMLPKLTDKYERVYLAKVTGSGLNHKICLDGYRFSVMLSEYTLSCDYAKGYHIILDLRTCNMSDVLMNFNPMDLKDVSLLFVDGYGVRVKGVHLISESKLIDTLITIVKQVISPKIRDRIFIHKNIEALYPIIDREVFPEDYGGKEKSLADLRADWVEVLNSKEARDYWRKMGEAKTDESKRLTDQFNDQYMGIPGTFRTLSVD